MSPAFSPLEIQNELMASGFRVTEVTNMVSWVTKRPLPMFKLILESEANSKCIADVKQVGLHLVTIEPFCCNRKHLKCLNCQQLNHTAGHCKAPPSCRKCSREHKTIECMTRSINSAVTKNPPTKTKTTGTQTPPPKEILKPKSKLIST